MRSFLEDSLKNQRKKKVSGGQISDHNIGGGWRCTVGPRAFIAHLVFAQAPETFKTYNAERPWDLKPTGNDFRL